jgi:molybdopterin/thiamine biosynthesis adenylyltransferase
MDTSRHISIFNPARLQDTIHVIGVGAVGSKIVMSLLRLGIPGDSVHIYDDDIVEPHNLCNQLFYRTHVGIPKVEALYSIIHEQLNEKIHIHNERVDTQKLSGIVFLCVDSMDTRRKLMNSFTNMPHVKIVFETRMGWDTCSVFSITAKHYEEWLKSSSYDDDVAELSPCGSQMTVGQTADINASVAVWQFIKFVMGTCPVDNECIIEMVPSFRAHSFLWGN